MRRTQKEILILYDKYYEMVWRICLMQLGNVHDAYDAAQETFIRLIRYPKSFHDEEHEKAWMIRTSTNYCRDVLKSSFRKRQVYHFQWFSIFFENAGEETDLLKKWQRLQVQIRW